MLSIINADVSETVEGKNFLCLFYPNFRMELIWREMEAYATKIQILSPLRHYLSIRAKTTFDIAGPYNES